MWGQALSSWLAATHLIGEDAKARGWEGWLAPAPPHPAMLCPQHRLELPLAHPGRRSPLGSARRGAGSLGPGGQGCLQTPSVTWDPWPDTQTCVGCRVGLEPRPCCALGVWGDGYAPALGWFLCLEGHSAHPTWALFCFAQLNAFCSEICAAGLLAEEPVSLAGNAVTWVAVALWTPGA